MAALSAFYPLVAPYLQGASDFAVEAEARTAAIDFCQRTLCFQRFVSAGPTVVGESQYTLARPGEAIAKLLGVRVNGVGLPLMARQELDDQSLTPAVLDSGTTGPLGAILEAPLVVGIYPEPSLAGQDVVVHAALKPSQAATSIDDALFEDYARVIADGAIARLASQPNRTYTSPQTAMDFLARFEAAMGHAKERAFLNSSRSYRRSRTVSWC